MLEDVEQFEGRARASILLAFTMTFSLGVGTNNNDRLFKKML